MTINTKWKKRWKKYRGVTIRTIIFFTILIIAFFIAGKKGGFFSISDIKNDVVQTKYEHKDGGHTIIKETSPDKVVDWIDSYNEELLPVIDNEQAYYYKEVVTQYLKIAEYDIIYRTDHTYDEVLAFYSNHYPGYSDFSEVNNCAVMWPKYLSYGVQIKVEEIDGQVEVSMNAKYVGGSIFDEN